MNPIGPGETGAYSGPPPSHPPAAGPPSTYPSQDQWAPGYPPSAYPSQLPGQRPNRHAFSLATAVGAVVWLAIFGVLVHRSVHDAAFVFGESFAAALTAAVPVGIIARSSRSRWPLWRYPAFIVSAAFVLTLLELVGSDPGALGRTHQRRTSAAPATVGAWARDDSAAVKARTQKALAAAQANLGAGDAAAMALYRRGNDKAVLLVVTTRPGGRLDGEVARSPRQAVVDELAGAGVADRAMEDPGPLGGALGCGPSEQNKQMYLCVWAELGTVGTMSFFNADLSADEGAAITREFRSQTEHD